MIRVKKAREPLPAPTSWVPATPPRRFLATNPHPSNYRIGPEPGPPLKSSLTCRMPAPTGTWRPGGNAAGIGRTRRSDGIEHTYCVGSHESGQPGSSLRSWRVGAGALVPAVTRKRCNGGAPRPGNRCIVRSRVPEVPRAARRPTDKAAIRAAVTSVATKTASGSLN